MRFRAIALLTGLLYVMPAQGLSLRDADSCFISGDYSRAVGIYTDVIQQSSRLPNRRLAALSGRASAYKALGEYSRAYADFDSAMTLASGNNLAILKLNRTDLLLRTGAYAEAARELKALEVPEHLQVRRMANISAALMRLGHKGQALEMIDSVIEMSAPESKLRAGALQNRAYIHLSYPMPDAVAAIADFEAALPLLSGADKGVTLANKALALGSTGRFDEAMKDIDEAIAILKNYLGAGHPDYLAALRKKMEILILQNQRDRALSAAKAFYEADRQYVEKILPTLSPQGRLDLWNMKKPLISEVFCTEDKDPSWLYDVALWRRRMTLSPNDGASGKQSYADATAKDVASALRRNEAAIEFICYRDERVGDLVYAALCLTPDRRVRYVPLWLKSDMEMTEAGGKPLSEMLKSDNVKDIDALYSDVDLAEKFWTPILGALPKSTSKIYFAPDGVLNRLAVEYLPDARLSGISLRRLSTTANVVRRNGRPDIAGAIIVGGLRYNTINPEDSTAQMAPHHDAASLLSDSIPRGNWFKYLNGSRTETEHIDTVLKLDHRLVDYITEREFKSMAGSTGLIHLSTHGYALRPSSRPDSPFTNDSITEDLSLKATGLALSGANIAYKSLPEDRILSAHEIAGMDMSDVGLVVLSACQTALGTTDDEGPAGLVRGLKKAGAGAIIASLWSVHDMATSEYMCRLYRGLSDGLSVYEAMQQARHHLQSSEFPEGGTPYFNPASGSTTMIPPRKCYDSPFFWAPFILVDSPD